MVPKKNRDRARKQIVFSDEVLTEMERHPGQWVGANSTAVIAVAPTLEMLLHHLEVIGNPKSVVLKVPMPANIEEIF